MKKLTKSEMNAALKKVVSRGNKVGYGNPDENVVIINGGKFCSDELREIARVMDELFKGTKEDPYVKEIQTLNIKGFTAKDIKVKYYKMYEDSERYMFSFYIMHDGKDWNFYYGKSDEGAGDWWPEGEDRYELSPIHEFIPPGFGEAMENCYEYHGSNEDAIELLKTCGFTVEHDED